MEAVLAEAGVRKFGNCFIFPEKKQKPRNEYESKHSRGKLKDEVEQQKIAAVKSISQPLAS